ncbi:MAG: hypothetical protein ACTSRA_10685, partial [Promethearchaeota archaeon]
MTSVDGLAVGVYNYTIHVDDGLGGTADDTVMVSVTNVGPSLSHPSDVVYSHGSTGNEISWVATDGSTGATSFTIYRNSTTVSSGSWSSGVPIVTSVDGLAVGV